jgi:hypothetical protein
MLSGMRAMRITGGLTLVSLVLASGTVDGATPKGRVYSVRDVPLGISLADFRALPHPDGEARPGARVLCSSDSGASRFESLRVEATLLRAGATKCTYVMPPAKPTEGDDRPVAAPIELFGQEVAPIFLFHTANETMPPRLAQITFAMSNRTSAATIALFNRAYGYPSSLDVSTVDMSFGVRLPNVTYVWANDTGSIKVDTISFVLNQMSVVFVDNRLWGDLHERIVTLESADRQIAQEARRKAQAEAAAAPPIVPESTPGPAATGAPEPSAAGRPN